MFDIMGVLRKTLIFGGIFFACIFTMWLNGEHGDPTGVRVIRVSDSSFGEAEFQLIKASLPTEWANPDKTPPLYTIEVKVNRVSSKTCDSGPGLEFFSASPNRFDTTIKILNKTDKTSVVAQHVFEGHEPPLCEKFGTIMPTINGQFAATGIIEDWIKRTLQAESTLPSINNVDLVRSGIYTTKPSYVENLSSDWFVGDGYPIK